MEQMTTDIQVKQRKNGLRILVGIFLIPIMILVGLNFAGFCFQKMKFLSQEEFTNKTVSALVTIVGLKFKEYQSLDHHNEGFFERDFPSESKKVRAFISKHPNCAWVEKGSYGDRPIESRVLYFLTSEELEFVNEKNINKKKIVGYTVTEYYLPCGELRDDEHGEILENSSMDLKYNPFNKNK
ncbi:MAG: hypothetical protein PHX59_07590 [Sulfuricurvum sp.]|nr:hypothetical protein [Sulfuricurvum sp.]